MPSANPSGCHLCRERSIEADRTPLPELVREVQFFLESLTSQVLIDKICFPDLDPAYLTSQVNVDLP